METGKLKIDKGELTGVALTVVGFITTVSAILLGTKEGFWSIYTTGFIATGLTTLGIGLLITIFSILKLRTSLLDLKRGIDAAKLGIILAISIIVIIAINVLVIPRLPKTDEIKLRKMPLKMSLHIRQTEHNFRIFFALSRIAAGITVCAVPSIKFFKN